MKAIITDRTQLNWVTLTRQYTFDLLTDDDEVVATSQTIEARPAEIRDKLDAVKSDFAAAMAEINDVEVGEEV
jgi:hypothetical protein